MLCPFLECLKENENADRNGYSFLFVQDDVFDDYIATRVIYLETRLFQCSRLRVPRKSSSMQLRYYDVKHALSMPTHDKRTR